MTNFNNTQPIYLQIIQRLCRQIIRGELNAGDKLPSVRELAIQLGVNPNTTQRVYAEMERIEVAETRRGLGTFITENESRLIQLREELMSEQIISFINDMKEMGFTAAEIVEGVRKVLEKE
ncbi:transcriptional regulator, GntR family [Desulforamulus reducens MI-1]|uniref:Transcriptional regulator, GntR family n=1 Tax=Desulforamulus reducens (strain ATCC BAA-1160 / DSM 100696 / MI-1) TaxID=349161 RepID=A4J4P2_DESRM|nr:GntR family transcriptional regulator [Desulforamulus reducens]ABO50045.1 transcriptional regulator, GntR family [Desulforamulus reducens MI-1]